MDLMELSEIARSLWGLWLMILFVGIALWTFWPSESRKKEMENHAAIPLREDAE